MTIKSESLDLKLGSRFQLTRLGVERCSKRSGHAGVVVGFSRANGSIRVLFDGTKSPRSLHRTYIEFVSISSNSPVAVRSPLDQRSLVAANSVAIDNCELAASQV
jgi:hypothetical protein